MEEKRGSSTNGSGTPGYPHLKEWTWIPISHDIQELIQNEWVNSENEIEPTFLVTYMKEVILQNFRKHRTKSLWHWIWQWVLGYDKSTRDKRKN